MSNNRKSLFLCVFFTFFLGASLAQKVQCWLTNTDKSVLFQKQDNHRFKASDDKSLQVISVDDKQTFQTIDGFGFTLTGGSAGHISKMTPAARKELLKELFTIDGNHIGTSYLRVSIGASDLNDHAFSYDDLPEGQTDMDLAKFDLGPDRNDLVPILKEILALQPSIKILGSPWSAPAWMKTNNDTRGGSLKPEYYDVYAKYLIKYIVAMKKEGIPIDAITVQNEPLHPGNNPSMLMLAPDQAEFVKKHLGPAFESAKLKTKIIIYDHNANHPEYPMSILNDPDAKKYIDGSAFHLYGGKIDALSDVHNAYPDKNLYFTEQWVGAPGNFAKDIPDHINKLIIGATRNWSRNVLEWNLSSNRAYQPHTDRGGCDRCLGAVTLNGDTVTRNPAYYIVAHAAKFVRPGSVRIASSELATFSNVAFKTPDGKIVVIVINNTKEKQGFIIRYHGKNFQTDLNAASVASYLW
jgi:glucosylceramidase